MTLQARGQSDNDGNTQQRVQHRLAKAALRAAFASRLTRTSDNRAMTDLFYPILVFLVIAFLAIFFYRAKDLGRQVDALRFLSSPLVNTAWYVFSTLASFGLGAWATRAYWRSFSHGGDYGFGGLIYVILAAAIFFIVSVIALFILILIGRKISDHARLVLAASIIATLWIGYIIPLRDTIQEGRQREIAQTQKTQPANHAPVGIVPEGLVIRWDAQRLQVTNHYPLRVVVVIAKAMKMDGQWKRCELKGSGVFTRLDPGQSQWLGDECSPEFEAASLEFQVVEDRIDPYGRGSGCGGIFKSDSVLEWGKCQ